MPNTKIPPTLSGPQLLPLLSSIQRDTPGFLLRCTRQYGDLVRFEVGGLQAFLVNEADGVRHILQDNHRNYTKNTIQYNALATITGRGLLTSDGALWFRQRRLEQPAFSRPCLAALDQVVVPVVQKMFERWQEERREELDIDREMMRVALEIVGKVLFSIDLTSQAHELTGAVLTCLDHIIFRARNPLALPAWLPTARNQRFQRALRTLDEVIYHLIHLRQSAGSPGEDLLGMLLQARDEETGDPMPDRQLRDEVITLLIAGHETVASALTWSWVLLSLNPSVRLQMRAEVENTLQGRLPTTADLPNLSFTGQVFSEALRLYPPAWLITRQAVDSDEIGGFRIPPRALIILSPYTIHRNPSYWENPEGFVPQRFEEHGEGAAMRPRYAYIPFGGGPRLCIGSQFAQIEGQLILAMVTQRFRLDLLPGRVVKADALVTLRPRGGCPMRLQPSESGRLIR